MFGIHGGIDSIYACHWFKVGVFDIVFFWFWCHIYFNRRIGFDVKIAVKIIVQIVVIDTVSFLNFFLPFDLVQHWYYDLLYACLGVHTLRTHCVMAMFAPKNGLWIPPSNSTSNPTKATMDSRVRWVQNVIRAPWYHLRILWPYV